MDWLSNLLMMMWEMYTQKLMPYSTTQLWKNIDKALSWPSIVFFCGCLNAVDALEYLDEIDHPSNMKTILIKLTYKLK